MGSSVYSGEFDRNVEKKDVLFVNLRDECCLGNDNLMMWPCLVTLWRKSNKTSVGPKTMTTFTYTHTHNLHVKMCHLDRQVNRYSLGGYWSHTSHYKQECWNVQSHKSSRTSSFTDRTYWWPELSSNMSTKSITINMLGILQ